MNKTTFLIQILMITGLWSLVSSSSSSMTSSTSHLSHPQNFQMYEPKVKHLSILSFIKDVNSQHSQQNETYDGRTFGLRRLKIAIPAIMFKLGVVTTMLGFLTLFTIKGLIIGVIILIIQLSAGFAKLVSLKKDHHETGYPGHSEQIWHEKQPQNIHVHVHGTGNNKHHYGSGPYSGWAKNDLIQTKVEDDYLRRLQELQELKRLRESLYPEMV